MVNVPKFRTLYSILIGPKFCFLRSCFFKNLMGMTKSVGLDQTAPEGAV